MKIYILIMALIFSYSTFANLQTLDRHCSKQVDYIRFFHVNGMLTSYDEFESNLAWIDNFHAVWLGKYYRGAKADGNYNNNEVIYEQIYEVAQQKYSDLSIFSPKYRIITAILNGTVSVLNKKDLMILQEVILESVIDANYSIINETDYNNAYQKLNFHMNSCNRIILLGHSQGNFYTNVLFEEIIDNYIYSDGYSTADYPMISLSAIAPPTSSLPKDEYKALVSYLTLDDDSVIDIVRILFGSLPPNFSAKSYFDDSHHGLIDSYLRSNPVASKISEKIEFSIQNQTPFPLFEQHPVKSDAFSHIGYSTINKVLDLKFESGSVYRYYNIPILVWDELYYSTSMGKFFNDNIRGQYPFDKLDIESMTYLKMTSLEPVAKVEK
jgi:hypothetical protein